MRRIPPLYENPDGSACTAACMKMGVEYFEPERKLSFTEIDVLTRRRKDEGTWPHGFYYAFEQLGYEIEAYEPVTDYAKFIADPVQFYQDTYADKPEVISWITKNYDLDAAAKDAAELMASGFMPSQNVPDIKLIRKYIQNGWLVNATVDYNVLHHLEKPEPAPHSILIYQVNDKGFIFNDPGPPAKAQWEISFEEFFSAWTWTGIGKQEMLAFRKRT